MAFEITPEQLASFSSLDDIYEALRITGDKSDIATPLGAVHAVLRSPDFFMDVGAVSEFEIHQAQGVGGQVGHSGHPGNEDLPAETS